MLAVTMDDLYPKESWNFVFGEASSFERVAVFSFARLLTPIFYSSCRYVPTFPEPLMDDLSLMDQRLLLKRSCGVMVHETIHMMGRIGTMTSKLKGVGHCVYYSCCMNGSDSLEESDSQPLHLCP